MTATLARTLAATLVLLLAASPARAGGTLSGVTIDRAFSPAAPRPGQQVTVTLTVRTGALSAPLRGFYLAEAVPDALSPASGSATLDGNPLSVITERTAAGTVYSGATTLRWVLEQPPDWAEGKPLPASSTLVLTYLVDVPAAASASYAFPGATWVGVIPADGDAGDHFGFEDTATTLPVTRPARLALDRTSLSFTADEGDPAPDSQDVTVANAGDETLARVETAVTYGETGADWLQVTRSDAGDDQVLQNAVTLDGLSPNTHTATVRVSAAGADNSPQSYTVSLTITARPSTTEPTIVLAPTTLSFAAEQHGTAPAAQTIAVENSGAGTLAAVSTTVSYISGADWLQVGTAGTGDAQTIENRVDPTGLDPETYTATVAVDAPGASNTPQNYTVSLTVSPAPPPEPDVGVDPAAITTGDAGPGNADGGPHALSGPGQLVGGCNLGATGGSTLAPLCPLLGLLLGLPLLGLFTRRRTR